MLEEISPLHIDSETTVVENDNKPVEKLVVETDDSQQGVTNYPGSKFGTMPGQFGKDIKNI